MSVSFTVIDDTHDLSERGLVLSRGAEAVRQRIVQRLMLFRAESQFDITIGVPYLEQVLGFDHGLAEAAVRSEIERVVDVVRVTRVSITVDPRRAAIIEVDAVVLDDEGAETAVTVGTG